MYIDGVTQAIILLSTLFLGIVLISYLLGIDKNKRFYTNYIIGSWTRHGISPNDNTAWFIQYNFNSNQTFSITADPYFEQQGNYKVVKEIENLLVVEAWNVSGTSAPEFQPYLFTIGVSPKNNTVVLDNKVFVKDTSQTKLPVFINKIETGI